MSQQQLITIAKKARAVSYHLTTLTTDKKNAVLLDLADELFAQQASLVRANQKDVKLALKKGLSSAMIDRLVLDQKRIAEICQGVREVAVLADPVGEVTQIYQHNLLTIKKVRIPLGVICMIYESRPSVTIDAAALCFKSGNAVILRGGSEAFESNKALVKVAASVLKRHGIDAAAVSMVPLTDRKAMVQLLKLDKFIDVVIPRGGEALMKFIADHTRIPVIKHDKGVCSLFVDESADVEKSIAVIRNAKVQRPGVCNALETLYVHQKIAAPFLPQLAQFLVVDGVEMRGDAKSKKTVPQIKKATEKDYSTEYLDLILSIKVVKDVQEAIASVIKYSSNHTDGILTADKKNAALYVNALNSSCVTVNSSTRFNDGGQLGLGAEIGISTTKLHAYGPMGLKELTSQKFVVESDYAVRS